MLETLTIGAAQKRRMTLNVSFTFTFLFSNIKVKKAKRRIVKVGMENLDSIELK